MPHVPGPPKPPPPPDMSPEAIRARNKANAQHWRDASPDGVRLLRQKVRDQQAVIEELVWAMVMWSTDEDDMIHPDAYPAFQAACALVGIPITETPTPGGEVDSRYSFDLDWTERQRDQWRKRMEEAKQRV